MLFLLSSIIVAAALIVSAWLMNRPNDLIRAKRLTAIAEDRAAVAWSMAPHGSWNSLLAHTVKLVGAVKSRPTSSHSAIEAAAIAALLRIGVRPSGATR